MLFVLLPILATRSTSFNCFDIYSSTDEGEERSAEEIVIILIVVFDFRVECGVINCFGWKFLFFVWLQSFARWSTATAIYKHFFTAIAKIVSRTCDARHQFMSEYYTNVCWSRWRPNRQPLCCQLQLNSLARLCPILNETMKLENSEKKTQHWRKSSGSSAQSR